MLHRGADHRPTALLAALLLAAALTPSPAMAAPPLTDGDYAIDLFSGPILGDTRVIGLGGAFAGVAEGNVAMPFNTAAVANRPYFSEEWFDWDFAFDFLAPGIFQGESFDHDNNGIPSSGDSYALVLGLQLQFGAFGVGLYGQILSSDFSEQGPPSRTLQGRVGLAQLSAAYGLFGHQLILGGGLRVGSFAVAGMLDNQQQDLFSTLSYGAEVGALWGPHAWPLRVGVAASIPFAQGISSECGDDCPKGFFLPRAASLPWQVRIGASLRLLSDRPYNRVPIYQVQARKLEAERHAGITPADYKRREARQEAEEYKLPRLGWSIDKMDETYRSGFYLLISIELVLDGPAEDATDLDGFVAQEYRQVGRSVSYSPRLGIESEVWRRRLRLRVGTYWEPSRAPDRTGRMHGTFSFDFRLFDFRLAGLRSLRLSSGFDLAPDYSNVAVSLGFWH